MRAPANSAADAEGADLPSGSGERFSGYGVMGLPFSSGHVLAMRRFAASSIGPAYTSVWHRAPDGGWVFWQDQPDERACPRYFSRALRHTETTDIVVDWPAEATLRIVVPAAELEWTSELTSTAATSALNGVGRLLPDRLWRSRPVLRMMESIAGRALRAGRVGMVGTAPNGQEFVANPMRIWVIDRATARLGDEDLGPVGPLAEQACLGDFWIPQRGVFAIGRAFFTSDAAPV